MIPADLIFGDTFWHGGRCYRVVGKPERMAWGFTVVPCLAGANGMREVRLCLGWDVPLCVDRKRPTASALGAKSGRTD